MASHPTSRRQSLMFLLGLSALAGVAGLAGLALREGNSGPNGASRRPSRPLSAPHRAKFLAPEDASPEVWRTAIREAATNPIILQAIVEARPGRDPAERARLLSEVMGALAALGERGRPSFSDFLDSPHRDVRLAAMNVVATRYPADRNGMIARALMDSDPVIRAKAAALRAASH